MANARLFFACTLFLCFTSVLLSHKNDPSDYDMDKRFPFNTSQTSDEQKKGEDGEDESEKNDDADEQKKNNKEQTVLEKFFILQKKRKQGPAEGH